MKKFFSLVLALVMALSLTTIAWGADGGTYSVADGDIAIAVDANGVQTVTVGSNAAVEDAAPIITGTDAAKVITVTTATGQANLTIKDLTAKRIVIKDSSATITLEGANVIGGSSYGYDPAIYVTSGTLTIKGTGSLKAESNYAAAIGSDQGSSSAPEDMSGTINIEGGTITAKSGYGAAIGAGQYGEMTGAINISGGTVNATGNHAAAIGGGQKGDVTGTIDISAGTVTAKASIGAAIGTGQNGDLASTAEISISGGTVSATADKGAGIGVGGGYISASETGTVLAGEINISGGDVTATSKDGAGIGAGGGNVDSSTTGSSISGEINITAGTVEASSTNGAGIGTGSGTITGGSVPAGTTVSSITGTINVSGGDVTASSTNSNAVGSGSYGDVDSSADVSLSTGDYSGGDVEDYVAPGSTVVSNGNTVVKNNDGSVAVNPVAQIGNTKYTTVADAIAAAGANDVIVLLDASATIPDGYQLLANGTVVATPAAGAVAPTLYVADNSTAGWATYYIATGADLDDLKQGADENCLPCYLVDGDYYTEVSPAIATYKLVYGAKTVYLNPVDSTDVCYADEAKVFTNITKKTDECGKLVVTDTTKTYYVAYDELDDDEDYYFVATKNGSIQLLVGGKIVDVELHTAQALTAHKWVGYDVVNNAYTTIKCENCEKVAKLYANKTAAGKNAVYVDNFGWITAADASLPGTVVAPSTDVKVESAETFDAGIALYVGMSVMAATGAVVLKKRED